MKNLLAILFTTLSVFLNLNSFAQELNPGDGVRITFLDIKDDISGDYFIQSNGFIQLPFIGIINTTNRDFKDFKAQIEFRYDSLYRQPILTVNALFRINVLGEVRNPGFYFITEMEKFTAILALAGGTTGNADLESIYLIRNNQEINLDVITIIQEGSSATDFGLQTGDQIYVPRTWWADAKGLTIILSAAALLVTIIAIFLR
ncbi:MAG: polysaccharide biosynthesis/export family protein [Ignavibacteriaceae bacterium]|jgi:protein involved in polysaccharide export with SLBB domain